MLSQPIAIYDDNPSLSASVIYPRFARLIVACKDCRATVLGFGKKGFNRTIGSFVSLQRSRTSPRLF